MRLLFASEAKALFALPDVRGISVSEPTSKRDEAVSWSLQEHMQGVMRWTRPSSGFSVWATIADGRSSVDLLATALAHDVAFEPGAAFFPTDPEPQHLRLSFSNLRPAQISEGVRRLADALRAG